MKQRRDGLLPRMQAIARKKGIYYRYISRDNKHIGLGYDLSEAIKKVLELNGKPVDLGKVNKLWEIYSSSPDFLRLAINTQNEYRQCAKPLLKVFGDVYASHIKAPWIYRYLTHHGKRPQHSIDEPCPTVTGAHRGELALIEPYILGQQSCAAPRSVSWR